MRYLGIDYGSRNVGISVSDESGTIAFPETILSNDKQCIATIKRTIKERDVQKIVIGDTRSHGGAANPITAEAETFIEELKRATGIPVARAFEAWTSIEASRYSPEGKSHNDASAAAIILQRYLDMRGNQDTVRA